MSDVYATRSRWTTVLPRFVQVQDWVPGEQLLKSTRPFRPETVLQTAADLGRWGNSTPGSSLQAQHCYMRFYAHARRGAIAGGSGPWQAIHQQNCAVKITTWTCYTVETARCCDHIYTGYSERN